MGIVLMRPMTSGVFQRLMAQAFREIDVLDVGKLLLNYVLSDPYVDVALIGMREPRFVELNNEISDDVASRIDLAGLHERYVRQWEVHKWAPFLFRLTLLSQKVPVVGLGDRNPLTDVPRSASI